MSKKYRLVLIFLTCIVTLLLIFTPLINVVNNISYLKTRDNVGIGQITQSFIILLLFSTFLERSLEIFILDFFNKKDPDTEKDSENRERLARKISFCIGILISFFGVRGLEPSIVLNKDIPGFFFRIVDSILTGTIVSGGTEAVHKVLNSLATNLDNSKADNKAKEAGNKAIEAENKLKVAESEQALEEMQKSGV